MTNVETFMASDITLVDLQGAVHGLVCSEIAVAVERLAKRREIQPISHTTYRSPSGATFPNYIIAMKDVPLLFAKGYSRDQMVLYYNTQLRLVTAMDKVVPDKPEDIIRKLQADNDNLRETLKHIMASLDCVINDADIAIIYGTGGQQ